LAENLQNTSPQLVMIKKNLFELPKMMLPVGYSVRIFKPGDEETWESIIEDSFGRKISFNDKMLLNKEFRPERVQFICYNDTPIGTATAWYVPKWGEKVGYLHMVGVLKKHSGMGLGRQVSLAAMHQMLKEGKESAMLQTDDFRLPAIKTYIKLGFKPLIVHENQEKRWELILSKLEII
jgi:mycothiol synthase